MTIYGIKVNGTQENLNAISSVFEKFGFGAEFDENGIAYVDEDYSFSIVDQVEAAAREIIAVAPNSKFIFRGIIDDDRSGEIQNFDLVYEDKKLNVKYSDWDYPEDEEDYDEYDWFGPEYNAPHWDYDNVIDLTGTIDVKIVAAIKDFPECAKGTLMLANLPLEVGMADISSKVINNEEIIVIYTKKFVSSKEPVDNLAESLGVVLPNSKYILTADFGNGDTYQYTYTEGNITCAKKVNDELVNTEMIRFTDEQRNTFLKAIED